MQNIVLRIGGVAACALLFVAFAFAASQAERSDVKDIDPGTPCAEGLVTVEPVEDCPIELEVCRFGLELLQMSRNSRHCASRTRH